MELNTIADITNLFQYYPPTEDQFRRYNILKDLYQELAFKVLETCPPSTERDEAIRTLHESNMKATLSISVNEK